MTTTLSTHEWKELQRRTRERKLLSGKPSSLGQPIGLGKA